MTWSKHQNWGYTHAFDLLFFLEALLSIWRANGKADMSQWLLWQAFVDTITRHSTMKEQLLFFLCILFNHCHKVFHMHRHSQNSSMYVCWSQRSLWQRLAVLQRKPLTPHQTEDSNHVLTVFMLRERRRSAMYSAPVSWETHNCLLFNKTGFL